MDSDRLKVGILARARFAFRSFQEGLSPLLSALQVSALVIGGSAVAYLALALDKPVVAIVLVLLGSLVTAGEGAFRLNTASETGLARADEALARTKEKAPCLSFGRAVIPPSSQPYELRWGDGETFLEHGRVIRVPVRNELGSETATAVQARLTFQPDDIHSSFSPKHPIVGEWDEPDGDTAEVQVPGNASPRFLNVLFIRDRPYPHAFAWSRTSRAAGLSGFAIASNRIEIEVEVTAAGSSKPALKDRLVIECRPQTMLLADWKSRDRNEEPSNAEGWDGRAM